MQRNRLRCNVFYTCLHTLMIARWFLFEKKGGLLDFLYVKPAIGCGVILMVLYYF